MITVRTEPCRRVWLSAGCQSGAEWSGPFCAAHFADVLHGLHIAFPNGKPVRPRTWGTQSPCFAPGLFTVPVQVQRGVPFPGSPFRQPVPLKLNTSRTRPDLEAAACLEGFTWHFLHVSMTGRHCFRPGLRETRHNKPETGAWCDRHCLPAYLHHWRKRRAIFGGATMIELCLTLVPGTYAGSLPKCRPVRPSHRHRAPGQGPRATSKSCLTEMDGVDNRRGRAPKNKVLTA